MEAKIVSREPVSSAIEVARYITARSGTGIAQLKLQKLLYYCQAASLAWDGVPLFADRIEAWANGPVVVSIWNTYPYQSWITIDPTRDVPVLPAPARRTIDAILATFSACAPDALADRSHSEPPWIRARGTLTAGQRGNVEIGVDEMHAYYAEHWK